MASIYDTIEPSPWLEDPRIDGYLAGEMLAEERVGFEILMISHDELLSQLRARAQTYVTSKYPVRSYRWRQSFVKAWATFESDAVRQIMPVIVLEPLAQRSWRVIAAEDAPDAAIIAGTVVRVPQYCLSVWRDEHPFCVTCREPVREPATTHYNCAMRGPKGRTLTGGLKS